MSSPHGGDAITSAKDEILLDKHHLDCGNSISALHDGVEVFPAIYDAIENSKDEILLEMYWLASDAAGWSIVDRLVQASRRGVNVRIIYDSFGSMETSATLFRALEYAGCSVREYNPLPLPISLFSKQHTLRLGRLKRRDHRKLMVVDRTIAFTGGVNFANFWLPQEVGGQGWRDVMIRIEGPSAEAFANVFDRMFNLLSLEQVHDDHDYMKYAETLRRSARAKLLRGKNRFNTTKQSVHRWSENLHTSDLKLIPFVEDMIHSKYHPKSSKQQTADTVAALTNISAERYANSPASYAWWAAQGRFTRKAFSGTGVGNSKNSGEVTSVITGSDITRGIQLEIPRDDGDIGIMNSESSSKFYGNNRYRHSNIQVITNDAWNDRRVIRRGYLMAINSARRNITIVNSYFLPDRSIRKALYRAVQRGVQVRVVVPGKTDVLPYRYFTRARYEVMLRRGIEIYEWKPTVLHAKVALFDDQVGVVGTYNFDPVSFRNNLEIVAIVHDKNFASSLGKRIEEDMRLNCDKIEHWDVKVNQSGMRDRFVIMLQNFVFRTMSMFKI